MEKKLKSSISPLLLVHLGHNKVPMRQSPYDLEIFSEELLENFVKNDKKFSTKSVKPIFKF